jgi:leucyl aminopeptidase
MRFEYIVKRLENVPNVQVMLPNTPDLTKHTKKDIITSNLKDNANSTNSANSSNSENSAKQHVIIIDPLKPFISMRNECAKLGARVFTSSICLCVTKLPVIYKYAFLTYASKALYSFDKYLTNKNKETQVIYIFNGNSKNEALHQYTNQLNCAIITRDLQNEPANHISPDVFCKRVKGMFKPYKAHINVKIMNEKEMQKEGLNLVLAIGMSSKRMPRFMVIECIRDKSYPTICLIGKTVIFDAGGLSIKTKGMTPEMKTDKSGGSAVVGIMKHFADYATNHNIIGILPIVENLLSEDVTRPGDIITAHDGRTVEITNIDAEGRLVMADAISYSLKYKPSHIIDLATLTGWAEGVHMDLSAVCYCRDIKLASLVNDIGEHVGERVWFLPNWDEYTEYTKSKIANVRNYSSDYREGAYMPSMFLLTFVPEELRDKYIHIDICNNFTSDLAKGNCVALVVELIKKL